MDSDTQKKKITIQSINSWIYQNFKFLLIVVGICLFCLIAGGVFLEWQSSHIKKVYGELYKIQRKLQVAGEKANGKNYRKQNKDISSFLNKAKDKKSFVYSEDMKSLSQKYEEILKNYKGQKVGAVFAIDLADFFYLNGEKERALSLLSLFTFPKKKSSIYHLVSFQLANYYMDEKNCEKALAIWKPLRTNKTAVSFHKNAHLQSALCHEQMKNYAEAKKLYTKIIKNSFNELDKKKFQEYIYLLTLKQKLENK